MSTNAMEAKFKRQVAALDAHRAELKKVSWPGKNEVYATTIVVVLTTVFFGFYLYGLDLLFFQAFSHILKQ